MINSLFMLGGAYNKDKKISLAVIFGWVIYMMVKYNFALGAIFPLINIVVYLVIVLGIRMIKNQTANTVLSISSILLWSIVIDTICFFMYPEMTMGQNLFSYVANGIAFNYKYMFANAVAVVAINGIIKLEEYFIKKIAKINCD